MYIYLDESGDLGFDFEKQKTTKKFVITILICFSTESRNEFVKAVRRTLKNKLNHKKNRKRYVKELKGTNTTLEIKKYFFRNIKNGNWSIYTLVLNKFRVIKRLQTKNGKKKLYNFLSHFLLSKLDLTNLYKNVELVVDRCKNKEEIKDFNQYLANQLEASLPLETDLNILHLTSEESTQLQAVDLFCWGIFRKYENADMKWYNEYRNKIVFETEYL